MDSRDIDRGPSLSKEGREGAGSGRTATPSTPLPPSPPQTLTRSELMRIYAAAVMPARQWTGPVFYGEDAYANIGALQSNLKKINRGLPPFAYGSRSLRSDLNTKAVMEALFPDGIPKTEKLNPETQVELRNVMESIKRLYETPGMQKLEIDKSIVVVCNEEAFINMMQNSIARTGEEL